MNSIEALNRLYNEAQHKALKRVDRDKDYETIEKDLEVLQILKECPFILERLFDNFEFTKELEDKYFFGTITDDKVAKVKEWLGI